MSTSDYKADIQTLKRYHTFAGANNVVNTLLS